MSVTNLTNTAWTWNFGDSPSFSGAGGTGTVKNVTVTSNNETFSSMTFMNYHGGDINEVYYGSTLVWSVDDDGGARTEYSQYRTFEITGGTDTTNTTLIGWIEANATMQASPMTVDISSLSGWGDVSGGNHLLTIKAKATGYRDSNPSTPVSFTKAATGYNVRVTGQAYVIGPQTATIALYDGQDDSGTELVFCSVSDDASDSFDETVLCTTGYIYASLYGNDGSTYGTSSSGITYNGSGLYTVTTDGSITGFSARTYCLTGDTLVTMADDSKKRIDEIELGEYVLSFDWGTLERVPRKVIFTDKDYHHKFTEYDVWSFDNGTVVKTVHPHEFYNVEAKRFMYMTDWKIGDHAMCEDGTITRLISHETVTEEVEHFKITLEGSTNFFANGLLTGDRDCPKDIDLKAERWHARAEAHGGIK